MLFTGSTAISPFISSFSGEVKELKGMLSSVSPEQQEGVDWRLKGPVRFMGPALLGLLRGAFAPRTHFWQLCEVRGLYCYQKGLLGGFCFTVNICLAFSLLPISLDQLFRQSRTLVCIDSV